MIMIKVGNSIDEHQNSCPKRSPTKAVVLQLRHTCWASSITWKLGEWTEREKQKTYIKNIISKSRESEQENLPEENRGEVL